MAHRETQNTEINVHRVTKLSTRKVYDLGPGCSNYSAEIICEDDNGNQTTLTIFTDSAELAAQFNVDAPEPWPSDDPSAKPAAYTDHIGREWTRNADPQDYFCERNGCEGEGIWDCYADDQTVYDDEQDGDTGTQRASRYQADEHPQWLCSHCLNLYLGSLYQNPTDK